jgi:hypothetical protein
MTGILHPIGLASGGPIVAGPARSAAAPAVPAQPDLLTAIIEEKQAAVAAQMRADERNRREDVIGEAIDHAIQHQLAAEYARDWPDEATVARYKDHMKAFIKWAQGRGLGHLPATASVVAAHLIDGVMQAEFTAAEANDRSTAIKFCHGAAEQWLDPIPIAAALAFIKQNDPEEAAPVAEAAADLELPKTNGNGSHE